MRRSSLFLALVACFGMTAAGAVDSDAPLPTGAHEDIQVTATRFEESASDLSTIVTVLDGDMLRARGVTDLRSALGVVAGVDVAPGGDGGPAASVPEMWGLREFDAFLLVVDGVPWGGAFNPDLVSLSLNDVARIEIMRGAAPVMYGATSFIGVIHVIHNAPGAAGKRAGVIVGTESSGGVSAGVDFPEYANVKSRIAVDYTQQGYKDDRTEWQRGHVLWRNLVDVGDGKLRVDLDLLWLPQQPASPTPRVGTELSTLTPIDSNINPLDAHMNTQRGTLIAGFDHAASFGSWTVTGSYAYSKEGILRGFLAEDPVVPQTTARGIRQSINLDELYFDGHVDFATIPKVTLVAGVDTMYGRGRTHGGDFDYLVAPDGSDAPDVSSTPSAAEAGISDKRWFSGLYGFAAYHPTDRWRLEGGLRLNYTREHRDATVEEFGSPTEGGVDSRSETMPSGSLGATFTAWRKQADDLKIFAFYRNTFKPAAIDFGLEAEREILEPEKGQSYELGMRTALFDRRFELEFDAFRMDLDEIVIAEDAGGIPGLENGGAQRLQGFELEARGKIQDGLWLRLGYSLHDAKFRDFVQDFGGVPTQLAGKRLEMSARYMGSLGVIYGPPHGFTAHGEVRYTGDRYLNRRNTALAESFVSYSAGIGWRMKSWELRLDGENLSDRRDPVAEAELADAQYYRLPARQIWLSFNWLF